MGTGVYVREVSVYEIDGGERKKPQEVFMEGNTSYITYGKNEKEIIKKGIDEIRQVLMGGSVNEKLRILTISKIVILLIYVWNWLTCFKPLLSRQMRMRYPKTR